MIKSDLNEENRKGFVLKRNTFAALKYWTFKICTLQLKTIIIDGVF